MKRREFLKCVMGTALIPLSRASDGAVDAKPAAGVMYSRRLNVRVMTDVFVAGGGPAGVAAAVAAARHGAKVFLAESHTCFGGMSTAGRVMVFMPWSDGVHDLAAGFGTRIRERLERESRIRGVAHDIEAFKRVYDREMLESGAKFSFCTQVVDVVSSDGRIDYVVCAAPSGMWAVRAKVYVDCTGNGELSAWAGAEWKKGDGSGRMMPASLLSYWSGIDWARWKRERPTGVHHPFAIELQKACQDGVITVPDLHFTGIFEQEGGLGIANMGHCFGADGTDETSVTEALLRGRASMVEYERYLHDYLRRGMENARLVATGELLGVRESRRITGDYTLTLADYERRAHFPDEIGCYAYPIDIHPSTAEPAAMAEHVAQFTRRYKYGEGENYGIPYRTLTPRRIGNLLVAGRCVSADEMVQASIRVIPACYITGQAAGVAAAMAANGGVSVHDVDVSKLRQALRHYGAYLPESRQG